MKQEPVWIYIVLLIVLGAFFGLCGMTGDAIDSAHEYKETYALGAEVTTTTEYETLTGETFSGHIMGVDGTKITVRNASGTERVFEDDWLQAQHGTRER